MIKRASWGILAAAGIVACASNSAVSDERAGTVEQRVLTPTLTAYPFGGTVQIGFDNMLGTTRDWIAIAKPAMANDVFAAWKYTNGSTAGSLTFAGLPPGTYVARAYHDWPTGGYNVTQTSVQFTVEQSTGSPSLTPPGAAATNTAFNVGYANLPGNASDWISIAPAGSPSSTITKYVYTNGATSGSASFAGLPAGSYEARAFRCWACTGTYDLLTSSAFTVAASTGTTTVTPAARVATNTGFSVPFSNMPGYASDWISVAPAGSPESTVLQFRYTNAAINGSVSFNALPAGDYIARAFHNWAGTTSYTVQGSAAFTVLDPPFCGDSAITAGETCDDGAANGASIFSRCSSTCALTNLLMWVDASDPAGNGTLPANATPVSSIVDKARGRAVVQANASQQPTFRTGVLGGKPALQFDGNSDLLDANIDINDAVLPNITVVAVIQNAVGNTSSYAGVWGADNGGWDRFLVSGGAAGAGGYGISHGGGFTAVTGLLTNSVPLVTVTTMRPSPSPSTVHVNGALGATFTRSATSGGTRMSIGNVNTPTFFAASHAFDGYIGEVLVYGAALTDAERAALTTSLMSKYTP